MRDEVCFRAADIEAQRGSKRARLLAIRLTVGLGGWHRRKDKGMQPNIPSYGGLADSICAMIREERAAAEEVLRDAARFIG